MTDEQSNREGQQLEMATFAGGCFWCLEHAFEKLPGVVEVVSGYTGGTKDYPTYEEVCSGTTGHLEAVQVTYDPAVIAYEALLDIFWRQIDPTDDGGQFVDRGTQYNAAIFWHNYQQRVLAHKSKEQLEKSGRINRTIVTAIRPAAKFYEAEQYHQKFSSRCPVRYSIYRFNSGRDELLEKIWGRD